MIKLKGNPYVGWIKDRIKKQKNSITVVNGSTGSGKSYASIRLAYEISQALGSNFTIKDNVSFDFVSLLKQTKLPQNTKPGTPFVFEEVGSFVSGSSSRDWQSKTNKFFLSFCMTTRSKLQVLIFNCPQFAFLDKGARSLCHSQLITTAIDYKKKITYVKPYILQCNPTTGKIYFKYLRFKDLKTGERHKLMHQGFKLPPAGMVKEYEIRKDEFLNNLNQSIIDDDKAQNEKSIRNNNILKDSAQRQVMVKALLDTGHKQVDIASMLGLSIKTVGRYKQDINKTN